jgi:hypothetical protein
VQKVDRHGFREDDGLKDKVENETENDALKKEYYYKLLEIQRLKRLQEEHGGYDGEDEEGEEDMYGSEEGEMEMDEEEGEMEMNDEPNDFEKGLIEDDGDEDFVSDDDEEIPELVPAKVKGINNVRKADDNENAMFESNGEISDIDADDYDSESEDYDSDELDLGTTENPHGFVFGNMLETFSKSRKDRLEEMRAEKDPNRRDKYKKKQATKKIGKSERVH